MTTTAGQTESSSCTRRDAAGAVAIAGVLALAAVTAAAGGPTRAPTGPAAGCRTDVAAGRAITPDSVPLRPTQSQPGARGAMTLVSSPSPYGVTVGPEGHHAYDVSVRVQSLRRREGAAYVVWVATPELDRVARLGVLGEKGSARGRVDWNKFLVFVSEEPSADVARWSGPIILTGLSPSGRMHTMAGHGPFEGVDCTIF